MDNILLDQLQNTSDLAERAAIIAESVLKQLSKETELVAHCCVILHWFDYSVVASLLWNTSLSEREKQEVYEELIALPFVEAVPWDILFNSQCGKGSSNIYFKSSQYFSKLQLI